MKVLSSVCVSCSAIVLLASIHALQVVPTEPTFNGIWWLGIDHDQRLGFVEGYLDCSAYVNPSDTFYIGDSFEGMVEKEDAFYRSHPKDGDKLVAVVSHAVTTTRPVKVVPKSTFGLFDGEDWRQGSTTFRAGFIEGYRNCYGSSTEKKHEQFPKSTGWYVDQISNWYGVDSHDASVINPKRYKEKIAHVLFMFKGPVEETSH